MAGPRGARLPVGWREGDDRNLGRALGSIVGGWWPVWASGALVPRKPKFSLVYVVHRHRRRGGTGKTYQLLTELAPRFTRDAASSAPGPDPASLETLAELAWWQVVALSLHDLSGTAKVEKLVDHPWLKAKYAAQGIPTKLNSIIWGQLQQHTTESSKVVKYARRSGSLLFDRHEDGRWFFALPLPSDLREINDDLRRGPTRLERRHYEVITFHQAYSYEDFIEGIRPRVVATDEDAQGIAYSLDDGVFLRAVRSALRLTWLRGHTGRFLQATPGGAARAAGKRASIRRVHR